MKMNSSLSDEMLGAYIDGEIDGDERERIIVMESTDKDLAAKICAMRKLKDLVKAARVPEPEYTSTYALNKSKKYHYRYYKNKILKTSCLAASLMVVFLVAVYSYFDAEMSRQTFFSKSVSLNERGLFAEVDTRQNLNLVMHLKSKNLDREDQLLQLLEMVLVKARETQKNIHVEVIVSGPGLHLLQKGAPEISSKIRRLKQAYQNLTFLACGKTLKRLEDKSGKDIKIIEEAMLVASGPKWIEKRRASGWAYILI